MISVPDPLPLIDGLLAATAKVHRLSLVTRNVGDVARAGISIFDPFATKAGAAAPEARAGPRLCKPGSA